MKKSVFLIYLLNLFLFQGCSGEADKVNISGMDENAIGVKSNSNAHSVTLVDIINNQLVIKGLNLDSVTSIQLKGNSFDESFDIESQSASEIISNGLRNMAILASGAFSLIISDAHGASSYQVDFVMQNGSVTAAMLSDMGANDGDGLLYNQSAGKWEARPLSGLNLIGTWDATANFPFLSNGGASSFPSQGDYYVVGLGGPTTIDTLTGWNAGDWILFNGTTWDKVTNTNDVVSFNGRQGIVTPALNDYTWAQIDKTISAIGDIADVDVTGAANGKVLKHNGTNWYVGDDLTGGSAGAVDSTSIMDGSIADIDIAGGIAQSKITNLVTDLAAKLSTTDIDTDATLTADSDTIIPSQKAIKSYVDTLVAAAPAGDLKKDGSVVMTADFDMGTFDLTNVTLVDGVDVSALKTQSDGYASTISSNSTASGNNTTALGNLSNVTNDAQIPLAYLDTNTSLTADSDTKVASQKAIKAYVDSAVVPFGSLTDQYLPRWEATGSAMVDSAIAEDGSGNIGIGITGPTKKLHVVGDGAFTTGLAVGSTSIQSGFALDITGNSALRGNLYVSGNILKFGSSDFEINQATATYSLKLGVSTGTALTILDGGNVGIGASTPLSKLHIAGVMRLDTNAATACAASGDAGQFRYNTGSLQFCNGSAWQTLGVSGVGLTSLGGQTNSTQTFAAGTSGTSHTISSSANIHTLNIPLASTAGVTSGTISKTEYDAFNSKQSTSLLSTNVLVGNGSNVATAVAMGGDATMDNAGAVTIANDAVTYAKMQDVSATDKLLGRATAGAGNTEEISLGSGLSYTGTSLNVTETDPSVDSSTTKAVPRWDGTDLVDGTIMDDGSNIGIGISIPLNKLHVYGGISELDVLGTGTRTVLKIKNSNGAETRLGFQSTTTSTIGFQNDMMIGKVSADNTTLSPVSLYLDGTGNVGIGETNPSAKLDVVGTFQYNDGNQAINKVLTSDASGNATWAAPPSGGTVTSIATNSGLTGGTITGSGTVGIATSGVTSSHILDATITNADIAATDSITANRLAAASVGTSEVADNSLTANDLATNSVGDLEMIDSPTFSTVYTSNWFRSTGATGWYNQTYGGGINMTDSIAVRVYGGKSFYVPSGSVGIGTTNPAYNLDVNGTAKFSSAKVQPAANNNAILSLTSTYGTGGTSEIHFGNLVSPSRAKLKYFALGDYYAFGTPDTDASFVITSDANGGFGGWPSYGLHIGLGPGAGTAGKPGGGSWTNSSDRRLKKRINDIEPVLDKLLKMRAVNFDWINPHLHGNVKSETGFIAQEVEALFPEWVAEHKGREEDLVLIDKDEMVKDLTFPFSWNAVIVKSLQELNEKYVKNNKMFAIMHDGLKIQVSENTRMIASFKNKLEKIKKYNKDLKKKNIKLENDLNNMKRELLKQDLLIQKILKQISVES